MDECLDGPRHGQVLAAQRRDRSAQVLTEELAHGRRDIGQASRQALEHHDAQGVQVGALVGRDREQSCRLRGEVADRPHHVVADRAVELGAAGEAEVDQAGGAPILGDDDVGGLDVSVADARAAHNVERQSDVVRDAQGDRDGQGPRFQQAVERLAGQEGLDEIQPPFVVAGVDQAGQSVAHEGPQGRDLMLEPATCGAVDDREIDRLHDHVDAFDGVARGDGFDAVAAFDRSHDLVPSGNEGVHRTEPSRVMESLPRRRVGRQGGWSGNSRWSAPRCGA